MVSQLKYQRGTVDHSLHATEVSRPRISWCIAALAVALIVFAGATRFYKLDSKLLWFDEETTFLHISSMSDKAVYEHYAGKPMPATAWRDLEKIRPAAPLSEVFYNLKVKRSPDQAPLFYLTARFWAQIFGGTVASIRTLTVIFSLLAFPLIFVLAKEMFGSRDIAWLSVALCACSPFQMLYAQEARPYSLWLCTSLLSWIFLCRAYKKPSLRHWVLYGFAGALSFGTHCCSIFVQVASFLSSLTTRKRGLILGVATACMVTALFLLPWFLYTGMAFLKANHDPWLSRPHNEYLRLCLINASKIFFDTSMDSSRSQTVAKVLIILLTALSIVTAYIRAPRAGRMIIMSAAISLLLLGSLDILFGGRRLTVARYLIPSIAVVEICAAAFLVTLLDRTPRLGACVLLLLVGSGIISISIIANSSFWWTKEYMNHRPLAVAALLNMRGRTLWISNTLYETLLMSRLVNNDVLLELADRSQVNIPKDIATVYVCDHNRVLRPAILRENEWNCQPNSTGADLFELSRR